MPSSGRDTEQVVYERGDEDRLACPTKPGHRNVHGGMRSELSDGGELVEHRLGALDQPNGRRNLTQHSAWLSPMSSGCPE
jgi:hypothetical protein